MENSKIKLLLLLSLFYVLILSACNQKEESVDKSGENEQEKVETLNQEEKEEVDTSNQDGLVESVEKISKNEEIAEDNHLNTSLTLVLEDVIPRDPSIDDNVYGYELNFILKYINHTDKDIKGFIAETYFYDMFGELVYTLDFKYEWDVIPANGSSNFNTAVDLNQFKDEDMRFYNLPFENMKFKYKIKSIIFTDGTSI
ncbi:MULTISPECIES: hypothetical protein [Lysinibacillus]|uniref:DUF4352 domain-containing protein n=1 Tax=Lysinibacillus tabacifolii TaxID=1173107 RepID=A0ABY2T6D1_9BACI|nr:hypothetical protein [Lysinibacillus tabacifolii]TKI49884.1 hypothetical protein FC748_01285 [Lysinibacillus tabacifolii]